MGLTAAVLPPSQWVIPQDSQDNSEDIGVILSKYSPAMYRAALRKLGNPADAEDALQDAMLSAARNILQFKGKCHISTWLIAIAINAARMQLRRRMRHQVVSLTQTFDDGSTMFLYEPADERPDPEEAYRRAEMRRIVSRLVTQLSPPLRKAFRLRVIEGLSIQEAARVLGVAEGTVKAQFFRARARIKGLMRESANPSRARRSLTPGRRSRRQVCQ